MKTRHLVFLLLPIVLGSACHSVSVNPRYERYAVHVDFDTKKRDGDFGQYHTIESIEVVGSSKRGPDAFVDLGTFTVDDREDSRLDAFGYDLGIGIREPKPKDPGWGYDWSARLGYYDLRFDRDARAVDPDWDYDGYRFDARFGGRRSLSLGSAFLLSMQGGAYYKAVGENVGEGFKHAGLVILLGLGDSGDTQADANVHINGAGPRDRDSDYWFHSAGLYLGFRLNSISTDLIDIRGDAFIGDDRLAGVMLSAGIGF